MAGIQRGFSTWEDDPGSAMEWVYLGTTTATSVSGAWVVSFGVPDGGYTGSMLLHRAKVNGVWEIVPETITLNKNLCWRADGVASNGCPPRGPISPPSQLNDGIYYDVQHTTAHESGHALGLDHDSAGVVPDNMHVMHAFYTPTRVLAAGDKAGVQTIYPNGWSPWEIAPGNLGGLPFGFDVAAPYKGPMSLPGRRIGSTCSPDVCRTPSTFTPGAFSSRVRSPGHRTSRREPGPHDVAHRLHTVPQRPALKPLQPSFGLVRFLLAPAPTTEGREVEMLRGFGSICVLGLAALCAGACGGDDTEAADGEGFKNRYLWNVGNCEVGTLTPINPETGETKACHDVQQVSECVGTNVFTMVVEGNVATLTSNDGTLSERIRFERTLDCANEPSLSSETCSDFASALGQYENLYVGRMMDRAPEEQLHPDGLWMVMSKPWPGVEGCGAEFVR